MSRIRDVIVPGSSRVKVIHLEWTACTVRCGRCGHEQEARAECRTARCKACGRVMRLDQAVTDAANVTPMRKRA